MGRPLRFIPPGSVVEVTARTVGSRYLLRPGPTTNELVLGVLGRAQELYGVRLFAIAVMSNHLHALVSVDHAAQLAGFMQHLQANIAKEVGRHHRWSGPLWSRRYRSIVVADADSQVTRLRYVLCQGLKEGLVDRVDRWPGVSSFKASTSGTPLHGIWYNRSAQFEARRRAVEPDPLKTERVYQIRLSQLPALADTPPEGYRRFIADLVRREERDVATNRAEAGKTSVLGARRILEQDPHQAPTQSDQSPAPIVHASTGKVRAAFKQAYAAFVDAFRAAAQSLRNGQSAEFPAGAFPPSAPFVRPEPAIA
jgi:REP element-mobilizing transposase RayT